MHWLAKFVVQTIIIEGFKLVKDKLKKKPEKDKDVD